MQHYLKIDAYALVLGIVLIVASVVSVIGGRSIDKLGKLKFVYPAACVMLVAVPIYLLKRRDSIENHMG